jgi:hypothetical protein
MASSDTSEGGYLEQIIAPSGGCVVKWHPGHSQVSSPSDEFAIILTSPSCTVGERVFAPVDDPEQIIDRARTNGLAILTARGEIKPETARLYRLMWLLYLRVKARRDSFGHQFKTVNDLRVRDPRQRGSIPHVLPPGLGLAADGTGTTWNPARLLREGEKLAEAESVSIRTTAQKINYGLLAAARLNPMFDLNPKQIKALVRLALFQLGPIAEKISAETRRHVDARLITALKKHLTDDHKEFDDWFLGPHNSLVHQIAKQRLAAGGELDRYHVYQVLLDRGWEAYQYVARCLDAQFRAIMESITPPLTPHERFCFKQRYCRQPYWGGLPFLLLLPRLDVLRPVAHLHFGRPATLRSDWVPTAHRLLEYYIEMANRRREVDRFRKKRAHPTLQEDANAPRRGRRYSAD